MRILIVKTSSLGDVVHMLPAITDAARMIPDLTVDWVVEESFQAVPNWHPVVDKVIPVAIRRWRKSVFSSHTRHEIRSSKQIIRSTKYDAIIDSQGLLKSSIVAHWAKGTHYGYNRKSAREPLASWAYDQRITVSRSLHAIERNRQITAKVLGYFGEKLPLDYGLNNLAALETTRAVKAIDLPEGYIVGLHGTSRPDKEWAEENWNNLAQHLDKKNTPLTLPWGNQREHDRAERIATTGKAIVLPKLDLDSLAHIITGSKAVVGMDTGLMHIAAALGKPGVAIYPVTRAELTGVISCDSNENNQNIINLEGLVTSEKIIQCLSETI